MPIFVGSTEITEIQLGGISNAPFESVFIGSDKVFSRPRLYDVTVGSRAVSSGQTNYGYESSFSTGSISNPQPVPNSGWFNTATPQLIIWQDITSGTSQFAFQVSQNGVLNNDSSFKTLTVNGTVFNRSDAHTYVSTTSGGGFTVWQWDSASNPFGSVGATNRIRFDRP